MSGIFTGRAAYASVLAAGTFRLGPAPALKPDQSGDFDNTITHVAASGIYTLALTNLTGLNAQIDPTEAVYLATLRGVDGYACISAATDSTIEISTFPAGAAGDADFDLLVLCKPQV